MLDPNPRDPLKPARMLGLLLALLALLSIVAAFSACSSATDREMAPYRIAYAVGSAADVATTQVALSKGGQEANPMLSWAGQNAGWASLIGKGLLAATCEWSVAAGGLKAAKTAYVIGTVMYVGVSIWNMTKIAELNNEQGLAPRRMPLYLGYRLAF